MLTSWFCSEASASKTIILYGNENLTPGSFGRALPCPACNNIQSKIFKPLPSTSSFAFVINLAVLTTTPVAPTIIFRVVTPALPLSTFNNTNLPTLSGNNNTNGSNTGNRVVIPTNNSSLGVTTSIIPSVVSDNSSRVAPSTTNLPTQNNSSNSQTTLNNSSPNTIQNLPPSSTTTDSSSQTSKFKVS